MISGETKKHPFLSRKFLVAVGVIISFLFKEYFGVAVTPETIAGISAVGAAYILGEAAIDWKAVTQKVTLLLEDEFNFEEDEEEV